MKVKMKLLRHYITNYPLSCLAIIIIWLLCLLPVPETPLSDVRLIDKFVHGGLYACFCMLVWIEYIHIHAKTSPRKIIFGIIVAPIIMGGMIELVQAYCTGGGRSGEWLDFAADVFGVAAAAIIGTVICILRARCRARNNKD